MFLFWIFRSKKNSPVPCCCSNFCRLRPLIFLLLLVHLIVIGVYFTSTSTNNYKSYPTFNVSVLHLHDSNVNYFELRQGHLCYPIGAKLDDSKCECQSHWHGSDCGIPTSVWQTPGLNLTQRSMPKRLIIILLLGKSIEILNAQLKDLKDSADVFVIGEKIAANHSSEFVHLLSTNWMEEIQNQILYERLDIDKPAISLIYKTLLRISDVRPDDLIMFVNSDEFPSSKVLKCLRLYDGFPDPLGLYYRSVLHGYKDLLMRDEVQTILPRIGTIAHLLQVCHKNSECFLQNALPSTSVIGSSKYPAGWRCVSCDEDIKSYADKNSTVPPSYFERLKNEQSIHTNHSV